MDHESRVTGLLIGEAARGHQSAAMALLLHFRARAWRHLVWAWSIALWLLAGATVVLCTCSGCGASTTGPLRSGNLRPQGEHAREARSLEVTGFCVHGDPTDPTSFQMDSWEASAVLVAPDRALTADHVVRCDGGQVLLWGTDIVGHVHVLHVAGEEQDRDQAAVTVEPPASATLGPISLHSPTPSAHLCAYPSYPTRDLTCGDVAELGPSEATETAGGVVLVDAQLALTVQPGNSGAGVWDLADGALVCIVTHHIGAGSYCSAPSRALAYPVIVPRQLDPAR